MEINAVQFRANCFKIIDHVQQTKDEVVITKHGKPVVRVMPIPSGDDKDPLLGAMEGLGRTIGDLTEPVTDPDDWEANQ
jgi:prevent-host-death family protein